MKCYDCIFLMASTGWHETHIQEAYTMFSGEPICLDHLAGKLSMMLNIGSNVVLERLGEL